MNEKVDLSKYTFCPRPEILETTRVKDCVLTSWGRREGKRIDIDSSHGFGGKKGRDAKQRRRLKESCKAAEEEGICWRARAQQK